MVVLVLVSRIVEMAVALKKKKKKKKTQRNRKLEWGPRLDHFKALTLTENSEFF